MSEFLSQSVIGMFPLQPARRRSLRRPIGRSQRRTPLAIESLEGRFLPSGGIQEFLIPTPNSEPNFITAGPDGNLWFTEHLANRIGRISTSGAVTGEFTLPMDDSGPKGITAGPDGNLWFTEDRANQIGQITTGGTVTGEFRVDTVNSDLFAIVSGPDGNLWFTELNAPRVGKITTDGSVTECPIPSGNFGAFITTGSDGNLWFTEFQDNKRIGQATPDCSVTDTEVSAAGSSGFRGITTGADGNLWFTEWPGQKIGRLSTAGTLIEEFPVNGRPYSIVAGPDGALWFNTDHEIGRITTAGVVTSWLTPIGSATSQVTAGPDGNIWFTDYGTNQIGKLHVLTASGLPLGEAVTAGQPLDAVVATFHDDEPGMLGSNYKVAIDWGDGTSSGQAWTTGGGNWVATGSHTYAESGHYDIAVTITDTHAPTGMTATAYSSVDVDPASGSGNAGRGTGFAAFADVAAALAVPSHPAIRLDVMAPAAGVSPPVTGEADEPPAQPLSSPAGRGGLAVAAALRHDTAAAAWAGPPAWLDLAALDLLARNLLA